MKKCLIVGAGGLGREVLSWALHAVGVDWRVEGFLDGNPNALEGKNVPYPVLGAPDSWVPADDEVFLAAIGDPKARLRVCGGLSDRGSRFLTLVHPSAVLGMNVELGEGTIVAPMAVITANSKIERFVLVNVGVCIGHDTFIGEGTTVSPHADILGNASIGRACYLGSHACILPSMQVGDSAVVGAGSAVLRAVAPSTTVLGVPAQVLIPRKQV